jgi:hypothetical protein
MQLISEVMTVPLSVSDGQECGSSVKSVVLVKCNVSQAAARSRL